MAVQQIHLPLQMVEILFLMLQQVTLLLDVLLRLVAVKAAALLPVLRPAVMAALVEASLVTT
jgi:hypothetical protein